MTTPRVYKYKAFISYRHQDAKEAVAIQQFLEKFRLPVRLCRQYPDRPKRLGFVFRDATDLPPAELKLAIGKALASSEYLIVLCSRWTNQPNEDGKRWVSEEVKEFLSLDEQNKYRIIPVLLPREDVDVDKAYMPTAVVALDILATDMARKGRQVAYFDIVAAMLNLDPVDLRNRVEEEERRQLCIRRTCAGVLTLTALAGAAFAWDYYVPKHHYYAMYEERNNEPVGIGEYSGEELSSVSEYYHFESVRYKVRRVEQLNYAGNIAPSLPYPWKGEKTSVALYSYDEQGRAERCKHLNEMGKPVLSRHFLDEHTIEYKKARGNGGGMFSARTSEVDQLHTYTMEETILGEGRSKNDIEVYAVARENGYVVQEFFKNRDGEARQNEDGAWGRRYERDAQGRVLRILFTDADGKPMLVRKGIGGIVLEYDDGKLPVTLRYVDDKNEPVAVYGVAEARYEWKNGNLVRESYYDATGNPVINEEAGCASSTRSYSPDGKEVEIRCYGVDGKLCMNHEGYAVIRYEWNRRGQVERMTLLDTAEKPVLGVEGYSSMYMEHDEQNRLTYAAHFDPEGEPCVINEGYSSTRLYYGEDGNTSRQEFYGVDGKLCRGALGSAIFEPRYNESDQFVECRNYGQDKKLIAIKEGWAIVRREYAPNGESCGDSYFGPDEKPCMNTMGFSSVKIKRGTFGSEKWEEWRYYDTEGQAVIAADGAAGMRVIYNSLGYMIRREFLGTKGELLSPPGRESVTRFFYDALGNCIKDVYEDTQGNVLLTRESLKEGTVIRMTKPATAQEPAVIVESDAKGRPLRQAYQDKDGHSCMGPDGYATRVLRYDLPGVREETVYYDAEHQKMMCFREMENGNKVSILYSPARGGGDLKEQDTQGRLIRYMQVDMEERPVPDERGTSGFYCEYDERGNKTLNMFLGVDGQPMVQPEGYAGIRREYDAQGHETLRLFLGADGQPKLRPDGYAGIRCEYDAQGHETLRLFLGADGQPKLRPDGYAGIRREYDVQGHETLRLFLGADGQPKLRPEGYAGIRREYDAQGHETLSLFLGADGQPMEQPEGYAGVRKEYNSAGQLTRLAHLDAQLRVVAIPDGYAQVQYDYAEGGETWTFLDAAGSAVNCNQGFAYQDIERNAQGNPIQVKYRDANGTPFTWPDGLFRKVYVYDESGKTRIRAEYYDQSGKLLRSDEILPES